MQHSLAGDLHLPVAGTAHSSAAPSPAPSGAGDGRGFGRKTSRRERRADKREVKREKREEKREKKVEKKETRAANFDDDLMMKGDFLRVRCCPLIWCSHARRTYTTKCASLDPGAG